MQQVAGYSSCLTRSKIQKLHFCILLASFGNKNILAKVKITVKGRGTFRYSAFIDIISI